MDQMEWDSEDWHVERDAKMNEWMLGNDDAVKVCLQTSHIAEIWDDLKDGDRQPLEHEISHAFESSMIRLQTNPFYLKHHSMLTGIVMVTINAWHDANAMSKSEEESERMQAFFLRSLGIEIFLMCAFLVGGYDHLRNISLDIRRYFNHETFDSWEHRHAT